MIPARTRFLRKFSSLECLLYPAEKTRDRFFWVKIRDFLPKPPAKIIDIGSGDCLISEQIKNHGGNITAIDVVNKSISKTITPILFGGKKIPFKNESFDTSLIIAVLHHTSDPESIILEAKRVSKKIVIVEDIFTNVFDKYLTLAVDSIHNGEFIGHPHSNKTDSQWKVTFSRLGLKIFETKYFDSFPFYKHGLYYLST